jgi:hypothetical protein
VVPTAGLAIGEDRLRPIFMLARASRAVTHGRCGLVLMASNDKLKPDDGQAADMKWYKDKRWLAGSIILPVGVALFGWLYANSSSPISITNLSNNTGIVTQGQTGGNNTINNPILNQRPDRKLV